MLLRKALSLGVILVVIGASAQAQEGSSTELLPSQTRRSQSKDIEVSLKAESLQYPTEIGTDSRLNQSNMIEGSLKGSWDHGWVSSGLDVGAGKATNLNYEYFAVQEIFSEYRSDSGMYSIGVGRKLEYWNQADRDWNLGLWEPLFQHDGLRIRQQGLTGLFFGIETPKMQILAFVSPLFVPTMTPDIAEKDGAIVSESRWFRSLPSSQSIVGKETRLVYDLQIPAVSDLINNPGYGLRIRVGGVDDGPWMSASYAVKAVNSLSYRYDASVLTQANLTLDQPTAEIELNPITHRHEIAALDFGYRDGDSALGLSMTQDRPESKPVENRVNSKGFQTDYIQQQIQPITLVAASASSVISASWLPRRLEVRLDGLKAAVENSVDVDARGREQSRLIPDRMQFTNAAAISAAALLTSKLRSSVKYLREFDQRGTLVSLNFDYAPSRNWVLNAGLDSLGVDDPDEQQSDGRFLNRYRQNDRVFGGLTYVY